MSRGAVVCANQRPEVGTSKLWNGGDPRSSNDTLTTLFKLGTEQNRQSGVSINGHGAMSNFPSQNCGLIIAKIRDDVRSLRDAVPVFASWRGGDLAHVCERYGNILIWLSYWDNYRDRCMLLLLALPGIQGNVRETSASGDWRPFNRAAYALQSDLDELLEILD